MRNIQLSEATAKEWIDKGGELKEIALQAYPELKRATKWEDCKGQDGYHLNNVSKILHSELQGAFDKSSFATENQAKAVLALAQLSQLYWNWYKEPMPHPQYLEVEFENAFPELIKEWELFTKE